MERLTEKTHGCFNYALKDGSDAEVGFFKNYDCFYSHMMVVKRLGEYEDLEEQGLLVRLPCKVGDTVYAVAEHANGKREIVEIVFCGIEHILRHKDNIGKGLYLTRAEAEKTLAEIGGVSNE